MQSISSSNIYTFLRPETAKMQLFVTLLLFVSCLVETEALIKLRDGGYEDIYVVIQAGQPENSRLVERIKEVFTQASQLLFTASENQVYFRKIKIVIPRTWSRKSDYKLMPALSLQRGFITIGPGDTDTPHVRGLDRCGGEGLYMYLSPNFTLNEYTPWGNHANVIVHEWGHFRWGLFDEYPKTDRNQPAFYQTPSGWKPATCTEDVKVRVHMKVYKSDVDCGSTDPKKTINEDCDFYAVSDQTVSASLMGHTNVNSMTMFCDSGGDVPESQRHNREAPNDQNRLCQSQSAWQVMRKHPDFSEGKRSLPSSTDTTPDFEMLQETSSTRVFVFDVSGSMNNGEKLNILQQTATFVIQELLLPTSLLGIVTFNLGAEVKKEITEIRSQSDRDILMAALPTRASGGTCIGCGVKKGIELLTSKLGSPENGEIILVSDGETSQEDKMIAITAAQNASVTVNTVVVTQAADTLLEEIATKTGGIHVPYLENGTISFASAFAETVTVGVTSAMSRPITLISEKTVTKTGNSTSFQFTVDDGAGKNTTITVLTRTEEEISIFLSGPDGYNQNITIVGNTATIHLPDIAEPGQYNVDVWGPLEGQTIEYFVRCHSTDTQPIHVDTKLSNVTVDFGKGAIPVVYALVNKGFSPVLNASVEARIEAQDKSCTIQLKDNGLDPDSILNDGTYSGAVLPDCLGPGRVAVKVYAKGDKGTTKVTNNIPGAFSPNQTYFERPLGAFQRVKIANNFLVTNYSDPGTADVVAPGRITDLRLYDVASQSTAKGETRNFSIMWTATGDDQSLGQAAAYEFRLSEDFEILLNAFEEADLLEFVNDTLLPKPSGEAEVVRVSVEAEQSYNQSAFFAVRVVDDAGNVGPVSNIVPIIVAKGYRAKASEVPLRNDSYKIVTAAIDKNDRDDQDKSKLIIIIVCTLGGVIVLTAAIIVYLVFRRRRNQYIGSHQTQDPANYSFDAKYVVSNA